MASKPSKKRVKRIRAPGAGRPRKPLAAHAIEGTSRADRHETRGDRVPAAGWPEKPAGLSPMQERLWDDVTTYLPPACLGSLDTSALRDMVRWYGVYTDLMSLVESDPTDVANMNALGKAFDRFWKYAQQFGLTPVARTRLEIPRGQAELDDDPMAQLRRLMESRN